MTHTATRAWLTLAICSLCVGVTLTQTPTLPAQTPPPTGGTQLPAGGGRGAVPVDADFTNRNVDIVAEGFDLALRGDDGKQRDSSLTARRLLKADLRFYASPSYVARRGSPRCRPAAPAARPVRPRQRPAPAPRSPGRRSRPRSWPWSRWSGPAWPRRCPCAPRCTRRGWLCRWSCRRGRGSLPLRLPGSRISVFQLFPWLLLVKRVCGREKVTGATAIPG